MTKDMENFYEEMMKRRIQYCAVCEKPRKYVIEDLSIGTRAFCSEKCYAEFAGVPVMVEGYYGLEKYGDDSNE
jgi:hypothetical protein